MRDKKLFFVCEMSKGAFLWRFCFLGTKIRRFGGFPSIFVGGPIFSYFCACEKKRHHKRTTVCPVDLSSLAKLLKFTFCRRCENEQLPLQNTPLSVMDTFSSQRNTVLKCGRGLFSSKQKNWTVKGFNFFFVGGRNALLIKSKVFDFSFFDLNF